MKKGMSAANGFRLLEPLPPYGKNEGERSDAEVNPAPTSITKRFTTANGFQLLELLPPYGKNGGAAGAGVNPAPTSITKRFTTATGFRLLEPLPPYGKNEGERSDAGVNPALINPGTSEGYRF